MSSTISFNGMPASIRVPGSYIEFDNSRALRGLTEWPARVLLLGQRLAAGTVAAATPVRVTDAGQARTYFGRGSLLAHMFEAWFRVNPLTEVWGCALDDVGAGVAANSTIVVSGTATASGVIALLLGGRRVEVAVTSGDAATAVASAIHAAINASLDLIVAATVSTNTVTVTNATRANSGTSWTSGIRRWRPTRCPPASRSRSTSRPAGPRTRTSRPPWMRWPRPGSRTSSPPGPMPRTSRPSMRGSC